MVEGPKPQLAGIGQLAQAALALGLQHQVGGFPVSPGQISPEGQLRPGVFQPGLMVDPAAQHREPVGFLPIGIGTAFVHQSQHLSVLPQAFFQ